MATLRDKMWDLMRHVQGDLKTTIIEAETSQKHDDYQLALEVLRVAERLAKQVRSHLRAKLRKTLIEKQAQCPHPEKIDVFVRSKWNEETGKHDRVVDGQRCKLCTKYFDLRDKVVS